MTYLRKPISRSTSSICSSAYIPPSEFEWIATVWSPRLPRRFPGATVSCAPNETLSHCARRGNDFARGFLGYCQGVGPCISAATFLQKSPLPSSRRVGLPWTAHDFQDYLDQWQTEIWLGIGILSSLALPVECSKVVLSNTQTSASLVFGKLYRGGRGRYAPA